VAWTPKILSEFEIGQAMVAIETVARVGKPLAEVGCRVGSEGDLEADLLCCVDDAGERGRVFPWLRRHGQHVRFGFYAEPWVLRAMDFMERQDLAPADRHWIAGLLFGYRSAAIQQFVERTDRPVARSRSA
jgi:hypothetical protein